MDAEHKHDTFYLLQMIVLFPADFYILAPNKITAKLSISNDLFDKSELRRYWFAMSEGIKINFNDKTRIDLRNRLAFRGRIQIFRIYII